MVRRFAFYFGVVYFLAFGVTTTASAQADEAAVKEAIEYLCLRMDRMNGSEISNYYSDVDGKLTLKTPSGERVIEDNTEKAAEAASALTRIPKYNNIADCEAQLLQVLLDVPIPIESSRKPTTTRTRTRSFSFSEWNTNCAENRSFSIPVNASEGWQIVPESIDTENIRSSDESVFKISNATENGFTISGSLTNGGQCGPFWTDERGRVRGAVHYEETSIVDATTR